MQADRLRLVGFKSFAEAAELTIGPGLTGIVGPNGCGKSNLAEALRWVMGENSARRLRGGAMDDVIFGGTAGRPARNVAEVALALDNSARDAPFAFNECDQIEIVRRIERGGGSLWRINGREARARDAQLLLADAATGGPSGAVVGQGRVSALIEAKPTERRFLLEEAAGIAGLQTRRRETEQRLSAAADNLARLEDVIATLAAQLGALKKQARQAQRYQRLGAEIRQHEALLLHARWRIAEQAAQNRQGEHRAAERAMTEAERHAIAAQSQREEVEAALPALRHDEAAATGELQRLTQARGALEQELARVVAARAEIERRRIELSSDLARETAALADAEGALSRLAAERDALVAEAAAAEAARTPVLLRLDDINARLAAAEMALQHAAEKAAAETASRSALERRRHDLAERQTRLEAQLTEAEQRRARLADMVISEEQLRAAGAAVTATEAVVERLRAAIDEAHRESEASRQRQARADTAARLSTAQLVRLEAEAEAIDKLLVSAVAGNGASNCGTPALSALQVAAGFEAAIGALFADELLAPLGAGESGDAAWFWADLGPLGGMPTLPAGAHSLTGQVTAPSGLGRRLALSGWVENEALGRSLQRLLKPGQRLVDRSGRLWRWDGFTRCGAGGSVPARYLEHHNRRAALSAEIAAAAGAARSAAAEADAATAASQSAAASERQARVALSEAEAARAHAQRAEADMTRRALSAGAELTAITDRRDRVAADLAEARAECKSVAEASAALHKAPAAVATLDTCRAAAIAARREATETRTTAEKLALVIQTRSERLSSLGLEERSWRQRAAGAAAQHDILAERQRALQQQIGALDLRPAAIAAETEALGGRISAVAEDCRRAAERLARGEIRVRQAVESCRIAEQALAEARERRARLEVQRDAAAEALTALARQIRERLDVLPESLPGLTGLAAHEGAPPASEIELRLAKLARERDGIGPVNLVAEREADAVGMQVASLEGERADVTEAISRLRRGAAALDDEGRQRLLAAFAEVNRHFATLFAKLFGGGKAELILTDDGDPLGAGIEIRASPRGKRLQSLSLLSGGEQALTALALLFAVFLTKPAPVCVLDEVDAPLDDANVDRLCRLVTEIAETSGTRFLLITHHRITMARADRLFGVTMAERGVSRLVSVDLARTAQLRRSA